LLECDNQLTDPSDPAEITTEIAAGRAHLLLGLKIGVDAPTAIEVDSNVSGGTTKLVNYDRTMTLIDGNVSDNNIDVYDKVCGGRVFGGAILYLVGTEQSTAGASVYYIDSAINFTGGLTIPNNDNEFITFNATAKWRKKTMGTLATAPAGIFE